MLALAFLSEEKMSCIRKNSKHMSKNLSFVQWIQDIMLDEHHHIMHNTNVETIHYFLHSYG